MRNALKFLCLLALALLALMLTQLRGVLPVDREALVAEKYGGWSGVLRVWAYEGWQWGAGSLTGWLNECAASFERKHPGVYVQVSTVEAAAIRDFLTTGINPPDAILFPPGLLNTEDGLAPVYEEFALREGLLQAGESEGEQFAVPVAMGLYAWAYNSAQLDAIPVDWRHTDAAAICYESGEHRCWGAALLSLCTGMYPPETEDARREGEAPGIDLGLRPQNPTPAPTPTPMPDPDRLRPCVLNDQFSFSEAAYSAFVRGEAAAMVVTQREIYRLQALSDSGKAPDWRVAFTGETVFTDQLAMFATVSGERPHGEQRQALCQQLLTHLLSETCQSSLAKRGVFSVLDAHALYSSGAMAEIETAAAGAKIFAPNVFSNGWRGFSEKIVRDFLDGVRSANDSMAYLVDIST